MMSCPSCQQVVDPGLRQRCPVCGFDLARPQRNASIVSACNRVKLLASVHLAFTIDATGSSTAFAVGIPLSVQIICDQVATRARDVQVTIQTHKDLECGEPMVLHLDRGTPQQAQQAMKLIGFNGGGDSAETHLDAIEHLANILPWRPSGHSRQAIVALLNADSKPLRSGRSAHDLGLELRQRGILLYLVCEEYPVLRELADAAAGMLLRISNSPDPQELRCVSEQVAASLTQVASSGGTVPAQPSVH
jgi:hypothetical protein